MQKTNNTSNTVMKGFLPNNEIAIFLFFWANCRNCGRKWNCMILSKTPPRILVYSLTTLKIENSNSYNRGN